MQEGVSAGSNQHHARAHFEQGLDIPLADNGSQTATGGELEGVTKYLQNEFAPTSCILFSRTLKST